MAAAAVLGLLANDAWQDVDVHGNASIAIDGASAAPSVHLDAVSDDTPNAEWIDAPGWDGVPTDGVTVRLVLYDEDISAHDRIGTVQLRSEDLARAYRDGGVFPVPVADQGTPVLFVRVSVSESP